MTAVTTTAERHRLRRLRRRDRRRRGTHGQPPDGRRRGPQPALHVRTDRGPRRPEHGQHRREPARPLPRHHQGPRRRLRRRLARTSWPPPTPDGQIQPDLVPVATTKPGQGWTLNTVDEPPRPGTSVEDLAALRTPFRAHGRVTAGNAAGLNDGATAALLASADAAEELGLPVQDAPGRPTPSPASSPRSWASARSRPPRRPSQNAGLGIGDIGLFEINEAFAVQVLCFLDHFGIADDDPRVNRYGGAIAVGHPLASSGVRLMTQLARQFEEDPSVRYGLTTMCIGLGMGGTVDLGEPAPRRLRKAPRGHDRADPPPSNPTARPRRMTPSPASTGLPPCSRTRRSPTPTSGHRRPAAGRAHAGAAYAGQLDVDRPGPHPSPRRSAPTR